MNNPEQIKRLNQLRDKIKRQLLLNYYLTNNADLLLLIMRL